VLSTLIQFDSSLHLNSKFNQLAYAFELAFLKKKARIILKVYVGTDY